MDWNNPRNQARFGITIAVVAFVLAIVIGLPLSAVTNWPSWMVPLVAGGASGLMAPLIARWIMARRGRIRATPSEDTDR